MTRLFGDTEIAQLVAVKLPLAPVQVQATRTVHSGIAILTDKEFSFEAFIIKVWFDTSAINKFNDFDPCAIGARATVQMRRGESNIVREMKTAFPPNATIGPVGNGKYVISWCETIQVNINPNL